MINAPEQHIVLVIPSPDQFSVWVKESTLQLGTFPSNYLLDPKKPGSKNRVTNFLADPEHLSLSLACELQRQILTDAVRKGVHLKPIQIKPLQSFFRISESV
ncbi:hypothetical protein [Phaeobacter sp. 11ANDIMAR09]|uniref:hypothetical protein n=1 Tax=Phaeobacter sp. 11ANDIMAR09 TaxID=1225647 RepID=UPI0006C856EA|nr:hypothetical protein [Phaeobacter sp. 11ANDIMAR09]KPD10892.1 hypothetical protein AN476_18755 [Phaeobacter sp. 11ANDIMAR09]